MSDIAGLMATLATSPEFYPQKLDLAQNRVLMIAMRESDYRTASFLDDRMLTSQSKGAWVALEPVLAQAARVQPKPLHFIFHIGHVGSTLLSRLLDETHDVLSLREPLPLRVLAQAFDRPGARDGLRDQAFDAFLNLWSRGYQHTDAVVLKATSSAARIGARLLNGCPQARAVYLLLAAEPSITTFLSGQSSAIDLNALGPERFYRMKTALGDPLLRQPQTLGELAAMSWLVERLTQHALSKQFGERILNIDFEDFLGDVRGHVQRVLHHFGLDASPERLAVVMQSTVLTHYSKAPDHAYSARRRAEVLAQTRAAYGEEIKRALNWLESLAARFASVAAVLS